MDNNQNKLKSLFKKDLFHDLLIASGVVIAIASILTFSNFFQSWHDFSHDYGHLHVDAFLSIFIALLTASGILAYRYIQRLKKVQDALEKAKRELKAKRHHKSEQEKLAALGELSGGLAHEINNALVPAIGMSEILKKRIASTNPDLLIFIDTIYDSSLHARKIVQNVLAFARGQDIQSDIFNAAAVFHETINLGKDMIADNVELIVENLDDIETEHVYINKTAIGQIFSNLFKNASDAMPDGGKIKIHFKKELIDSDISIDYDLTECDHILVKVTDTGIGMSDDVLKKAFDPFFTTKDVDQGTGLGLSTVFGIMKNLGGAIIGESELGKGTTFTLYFPCTNPDLFIPIIGKVKEHAQSLNS